MITFQKTLIFFVIFSFIPNLIFSQNCRQVYFPSGDACIQTCLPRKAASSLFVGNCIEKGFLYKIRDEILDLGYLGQYPAEILARYSGNYRFLQSEDRSWEKEINAIISK